MGELDEKREAALAYLKKNYDTETICPYCGSGPKGESIGCCGESSSHFEEAYIDENNEIIDVDEFIENFYEFLKTKDSVCTKD